MIVVWSAFLVLILGLLALDLGVLNKNDHVVSFRESLRSTVFSIIISLSFTGVVWLLYEHHVGGLGTDQATPSTAGQAVLSYLAGYVVEYSLSVDNIFVIALLIKTFHVPDQLQHRVLFWGILGALILRGIMIGAGALLLHKFEWMMYVFGGILMLTSLKIALSKGEEKDVKDSFILKMIRKMYPVSPGYHGRKFFITEHGKRAMTPLMVVLLMVESTDVLFAVDSIPAVFAVTQDPFLVFTSNVFAVLGLRSLYFAIAGLLRLFRYLKQSLVVLLAFIGIKMLIKSWVDIPTLWSLLAIVAILGAGVLVSVLRPEKKSKHS